MAGIKGLILCVFGGTCPSCKEMDVLKVLDAIRQEKLVDFVEYHPQICAEDGNQYLKDLLGNMSIDKLYVAGCDPLMQKKMFQKSFKAVGFDKAKLIAIDVRSLTTEQAVAGIKELIEKNP
jgi:heterodisulfide reductase subunit A-like polyferredoxin